MKGIQVSVLAVSSFALLGASAFAQSATARDSVRLRPVADVDARVDRLTRDLGTQRRLQIEIGRALFEFRAKARASTNEPRRAASEEAAQVMVKRIREASSLEAELRKQLEALCTSREKPEGWIGFALIGELSGSQQGSRPNVIVRRGYPTVESVDPGSPAVKAGIRSGDVIIAIDGREFRTLDVITPELLRPGAKVAAKIRRDGVARIVTIHVEPRPDGFETPPCQWLDATIATAIAPTPPNEFFYRFSVPDSAPRPRPSLVRTPRPASPATTSRPAPMPLPPEPPLLTPSPFTTSLLGGTMLVAGAQVVPMNPELGQNFGVEEGLLVLKVLPGTPAYRSELRGGDVLLTANEQDLTSARVLQREMNLSAEHEVKLLIVRQKRRQTITLRW